jgi:lipoprotein NlpD
MMARLTATLLCVIWLVACGAGPPAPVRDIASRPPAQVPGEYVVKRGDTLYSIAFQYGYSYQEVAAWNNIRPPYTIYIGQRLRVTTPGSGAAPSPPPVATAPPPVTRPVPDSPPYPPSLSVPAPSAPLPSVPVAPARPVLSNGPVRWRWPVQGRLLKRFDAAATGRKGIDIGGAPGQPVYAAADGQVVYSGSGLIGYGQLIIIKHNKALLSAYAFNRKLLVEEGHAVTGGQLIAEMGSHNGQAMLHFEIRNDGKPVDPMSYLPRL